MLGHQGRPLPGDLVLQWPSRHVPAQFVNEEAAHAAALFTLRPGDVGVVTLLTCGIVEGEYGGPR